MTTRFKTITSDIIRLIEGGYYHPDMCKDGRIKSGCERMGKSGETMFGIDRAFSGESGTAYNEFWRIIDNAGARKSWTYNSKGGRYEQKLRDLAVEVMFSRYNSFWKKYGSPDVREITDKDDRLTFHMVYAIWNGAWWFGHFNTILKQAIQKTKNPNKLWDIALDSRLNNRNKEGRFIQLIADGGKTMQNYFKTYKSAGKSLKYLVILVLSGGLAYGGYKFYKRKKTLKR